MTAYTLVMVTMVFSGAGGPSVTTHTHPVASEGACYASLDSLRHTYRTTRPNHRILFEDCVRTSPRDGCYEDRCGNYAPRSHYQNRRY